MGILALPFDSVFSLSDLAHDLGTPTNRLKDIHTQAVYATSVNSEGVGNHLNIISDDDLYLTAQDIVFTTNDTVRWFINSAGVLAPIADDTYDIGTSTLGARRIYATDFYGSGANLTDIGPGNIDLAGVYNWTGYHDFIGPDQDLRISSTGLVSLGGPLRLWGGGTEIVYIQQAGAPRWQFADSGKFLPYDDAQHIGHSDFSLNPNLYANDIRTKVGGNIEAYNAYTNETNYERGYARWESNVFKLGAEADGTGVDRDVFLEGPSTVALDGGSQVKFNTNGGTRWLINDTGVLYPGADLGVIGTPTRRVQILGERATYYKADLSSYARLDYDALIQINGPTFQVYSVGDLTLRAGGNLQIMSSANSAMWNFNSAGEFYPIPDNAYDIGRPAQKVSNVYATTINVGHYDGVTPTASRMTLIGDSNSAYGDSFTIALQRPHLNPGIDTSAIIFERGGGSQGGGIRFKVRSITGVDNDVMRLQDNSTIWIRGNTYPVGGSYKLGHESYTYSEVHADTYYADDIRINGGDLRVFNNYIDGSNHEILELSYSANVSYLRSRAAGTGITRELAIVCDDSVLGLQSDDIRFRNASAVTQWRINSVGVLYPNVDDTYQIGSSTRYVSDIYATNMYGSVLESESGPLTVRAAVGQKIGFATEGSTRWRFEGSGVFVPVANGYDIGLANLTINPDVYANDLATKGTAYFYNTYTDTSNYERIELVFSGNNAHLRTAEAGTGVARDMYIRPSGSRLYLGANNSTRFAVSTTSFSPQSDGVYDLGSDTYRFRFGYFDDVRVNNTVGADGFDAFNVTGTDFEKFYVEWSANVCKVGVGFGGAGTGRTMNLQCYGGNMGFATDGTRRVNLTTDDYSPHTTLAMDLGDTTHVWDKLYVKDIIAETSTFGDASTPGQFTMFSADGGEHVVTMTNAGVLSVAAPPP